MEEYFILKKKVLPNYFDELYEGIKGKMERSAKGRKSCIFNLHELDLLNDTYTNKYSYLEVPKIIEDIRTKVEILSKKIYDYVLVHIYFDGEAGIAYHFDSEAMISTVCSVSFGASRKFRLRETDQTKGFCHEFILQSGDVLLMLPGAQTKYRHSVPVEKRVKEPRINLTFRQYEI